MSRTLSWWLMLCLCRAYLIEKLEVGKWIFLWVVLAEAGSLVLAMIMRCMGELQGRCADVQAQHSL